MVRLLTVENLQSPQRSHRRSVTAASAAAVIAMSLGLLAPTGVVAQVIPTVGDSNVIEYADDTVTLPEHVCVQDTPMLQSAIYGSHSLNETDGLFDGCDARRPYCIKSDGIYRRGYTVVSLKSATNPDDDLILQSGEPYTTVVLEQNYGDSTTEASKGFKGAGVGPLRITFRTDSITTAGKFCTSASGTVPSFAGGTATCDANQILTDARRNFLINTIIPKATAMLSSRLNVNQINGNLFVPSTNICTGQQVVSSSDVTKGIANTDFVVYISAAPTAAGSIAWAGPCSTDTNGRPIVGMMNVSPQYLDAGSDLNTDHTVRVIVHELMHALGFSGGYMDSTLGSGVKKSATRRGEPVSLFMGAKANAGQQKYFGCNSVSGVEIENEGAVGSSGSHWKRRLYFDDVMSPVAGQTLAISSMTLGYFEDTGKYFPDYSQAEDGGWLKGFGCGAFDSNCGSTNGGQGRWFCNANGPATCTGDYRAIGACAVKTYTTTIPSYWQYFSDKSLGGTQAFMGYCPIVSGYSNRQCYDASTATANTVQAQYYGSGGRCFTTTATLIAAGWGFGSSNPGPARCMQSRCLDGKQVQFQIGTYTSWISCPADGSAKTLDMADYGYTGTVDCPKASDFCTPDLCVGSCSSETTTTTTTTTKPTTTSTTTTTTKPTTTTTTTTKPTTTTTTTKPTTTTTTKPTTTTTTTKPTTKPTTTTTTTTKPTTTTTAKPTTPTTTAKPATKPPTTTTSGGLSAQKPASCSSYLLSGASPSSVLSTAQINLLLQGHNDARQAVKPYAKSMPMLQWDQGLADFAQSYLDTCPGLSYSPVNRRMNNPKFPDWWYIGENMAAGPEVKPDNLKGVVDAWVEGGAGYQYPDCVSGWCGAYKQIVWAATTKMGCAYKYCPNDKYQYYWICNFGVGGNVQGQNPYTTTPYVSESAECTSDRYAATDSATATDACDASYFVSGKSPSPTLSTDTINILLKGHNDVRRDVQPYADSMPMLQWNQKLADFAQAYLDTCPGLANSPVNRRMSNANFPGWWYVGESMVAGENLTPDYIQDAISAWSEGSSYWTYPNTCAAGGTYMCTTYMQMIWAQTTDIGCAYKYCPSLPYKYYWVCNYGVGGSVQGQSPYVKQTDLTQTAACTRARTSSQSRVMQPKSFDASKYAIVSSPMIKDMMDVAMPAGGPDMAGFEEPPKTAKKSLAEKLREAKDKVKDKAKAVIGEDAKPGKSQLEL